MPRYSKLKKRIENLFAPGLKLNIYCTVFPSNSFIWPDMTNPRIWITLNKETIFDFIKDFTKTRIPVFKNRDSYCYPGTIREVYYEDVTDINNIIEKYIEHPINTLFEHVFEKDCFGLTDILKAADRRIGKKRLLLLMDRTRSEAAKKVINKRLGDEWM